MLPHGSRLLVAFIVPLVPITLYRLLNLPGSAQLAASGCNRFPCCYSLSCPEKAPNRGGGVICPLLLRGFLFTHPPTRLTLNRGAIEREKKEEWLLLTLENQFRFIFLFMAPFFTSVTPGNSHHTLPPLPVCLSVGMHVCWGFPCNSPFPEKQTPALLHPSPLTYIRYSLLGKEKKEERCVHRKGI